ncbi:hypothetical protein SDC9_146703 [bioreactor metagenome]|uniref:Membrane transport protein MMPL domain-containing protein n=1 Tax=bioreactor metagenome TaxID=1076179 RepID=A0A645EE07_9ZZZZ
MRNGHDKITAMKIAGTAADKSIFQSAIVFFSATFGVYLISNISIIKSICAMLARGSAISAIVIIFLLKPILIISEKFISKTTYNWYGTKIKRSKSK